MDQIVHDIRKENWMSIISECNQSTLTKIEWCRQNDISIKSFYYWQRKLRKEAVSPGQTEMVPVSATPVSFAKISVTPQSFDIKSDQIVMAVISKSDMHIEILNTASEEFLLKLMRSVSHA